MPASDPIQILLTADRWATRNIIEACAKLTPEQFHKLFDMGPGSLHDTVTHILNAMRGWGDLIAGRERRPSLSADNQKFTCNQLLTMFDEITGDFAKSAAEHPLTDVLTTERGGKTYTFARGLVITHVTTHGFHHRAQCLNMLRHVGVNPLPLSSVVEWSRAGEPSK